MRKEKRKFLVLIPILIILNINLSISAFSSGSFQNSSLQWFPSLAVDKDTLYVIWADERNGNYTRIMNNQPHKSGDVYFAKTISPDGQGFDKNVRINDLKGSTGHGSPSLVVDDNNLYAIWEDDRFGFEELYFATSPKNSIKFGKDLPVVSGTGSWVLPSMSVRNGTVYIAMMNKKTWDIEFTEGRASNGVYRFDKPVKVNDDTPGNWHYAPSLAVDDEKNVCIAWLDARNSNYDIYFSHGVKENGIWQFGRNLRVNDDFSNASQYTPSVAFENGSVYIAWYDDRNTDFDIYFSTGRPENSSWGFDKSIMINDKQKGNQMHPDIAVRDGEIFAVWEDGRDGASNIYFSKGLLGKGGIEFSRNTKVNNIKGNHYDPQLKISGNDVYVVWQGEVNDSGDIFFSHGKFNGKNWEFGDNIRVNDDLTDSFIKPDPVFLGSVIVPVILSIISVGFLRRKYGKRR